MNHQPTQLDQALALTHRLKHESRQVHQETTPRRTRKSPTRTAAVPHDFSALVNSWTGGLANATPENLGTDVCETFKCQKVVEPEPALGKKMAAAREHLLALADVAYDANLKGEFSIEAEFDQEAARIRLWLTKAEGIAGLIGQEDEPGDEDQPSKAE